MTKAIPAILVLVLALACLFALSAALPPVLDQTVSAQTKPNVPCTLLGKPYRRRRNSQGCPPSHWILAVTDRHDADPGHASAQQAQIGNSDWTQTKLNTKQRVPLPLPLVLDTFPESGLQKRLMRSKWPMRYSPCSDNAPLSGQARSDGTNPRDQDEQRVQSPIAPGPERKTGSREVSMPVRRSTRLYARGEWKSRLFDEY